MHIYVRSTGMYHNHISDYQFSEERHSIHIGRDMGIISFPALATYYIHYPLAIMEEFLKK